VKVERALSSSLPAAETPCLVAPDGFLGAYRRAAREPAKPDVLSDLLALIGYDAQPAVIESWSLQQRVEAEVYAINVHLKAGDNKGLRKHPKPAWMPEPWEGAPVDTSAMREDLRGAFDGPGGTVLP
jgi:hypothetical protein